MLLQDLEAVLFRCSSQSIKRQSSRMLCAESRRGRRTSQTGIIVRKIAACDNGSICIGKEACHRICRQVCHGRLGEEPFEKSSRKWDGQL